MNEALLDAFRHSAWATKQVLASCRGLSREQLTTAGAGTYGDILATFNHLVRSDAGYLWGLTGSKLAWMDERDATDDLDVLETRWDETQASWEEFLSRPLDAQRLLSLDEGTFESRASVSVVEALHHAGMHREQICSMLTALDVEAPDIEAWEWALQTGLARHVG